MNFSEAMFYENYLTSDFNSNNVISRRVCPLARQNGVENRDKAVIRPIVTAPRIITDHKRCMRQTAFVSLH